MSLNPSLVQWRGLVVWLVGGSTGIGRATASLLHAKGATVVLSARGRVALDTFTASHAGSRSIAVDVTDVDGLQRAHSSILATEGKLDLVVCCAGYYKPQRATEFDLANMLRHQEVNYVGTLNILNAVLPDFLKRGSGHISIVSSVAGFRGLPNSLAYGPTKAALINLADALYLDLHDQGLGVSVINPGFVDTPLTAQNAFAMPGLLTPGQAAERIVKGWEVGDFEIHFPKRFSRMLKVLGVLPDSWYFKAVKRGTGM